MDISSVLTFIVTQATQEDLTRIYEACRVRNDSLARTTAILLRKGDKVRLVNIRPKYLSGLEGTVELVKGKTATILFTERLPGRYSFQNSARVPTACLEKIS